MKKLGLWMLAAILLCGSVVTFVACRGNSLEDIIGNVDNGSGNSDAVKKWILESLTDGAVFKIGFTDGTQTLYIKYQYDADGNVFTKIAEGSSANITPFINYDKETGIITAKIVYSNGSTTEDRFGVIFNAQTNEYSKVNCNASYDFESILLCNDDEEIDLTAKLTDACPKKATVEGAADLFYVYYASGETWEDVAKRYTQVFGADKLLQEGTGDNNVSLKWGSVQNLYYRDVITPVKYNYIVGKEADGTTDYEGSDCPYRIPTT